MKLFMPEYRLEKFYMADVSFCRREGIEAFVLDIDNTLEPYEHPVPTEAVKAWFSALKEAGIQAAFVSNNSHERVTIFNEELGLPAFAKAGKPFAKSVKKAMAAMQVSAERTVLMGDQVFTDVLAAHLAGIRSVLVPPIHDKTDLLTRTKRWLERPILKRYEKKEKQKQ